MPRRAWALATLALSMLWLALASTSRARVQPYYVLGGATIAELRPRVLFVLDTSGSMNWKSQVTDEQCVWEECETGSGAAQSRIASARHAIRSVVDGMGDSARFGLMTFDRHTTPTSVPPRCVDGHRFKWVSWYAYFQWDRIRQYPGYYGSWRLCDDVSRPYPYLRWDELGVGSVVSSNNETGTVPASPMISTAEGDMTSTSNADRRVQWFPRFMGVRAQLNATTDPDGSITAATIGDWASNDTDRRANVWGHDFYYWPYVDGFPGYAGLVAWPADNYPEFLGVVGEEEAVAAASLYAPFYLDLDGSAIPSTQWGPDSEEQANQNVAYAASPLIEGGVDASGGTPWASVIGTIPGSVVQSNEPHSHSTVASYLAFATSVEGAGACTPTSAVLVTDGQPSPDSEGGSLLYERLSALRSELAVKTYVVGFFVSDGALNDMACAAAGACSDCVRARATTRRATTGTRVETRRIPSMAAHTWPTLLSN